MSNGNSSSSSSGIGFVGLLQVAFIVLKLTNYINWSWVWVLSPVWISGLFTIMVLIVISVPYIIIKIKNKRKKR